MWRETQNAIKLGRSPMLVRPSSILSTNHQILMTCMLSKMLQNCLVPLYLNITTLYFSAVATYTAEEVRPSSDLGERWLEVEAKRNCRFFSS